jgi:hypothetical protein
MPSGSILEAYVRSAPSAQNAVDIFKGEWASRFPAKLAASVEAGGIPLFEDDRIVWAVEQLGGMRGKRVLELGPLEGGHSYMLEQSGAASIVSIESNTRAYLKCLISKELLEMTRVRFLCGDFIEYLKSTSERFDVIFGSGVLYHMRNPVELLSLLASHTNRVYLWTHYFDPAIKTNPALTHKFKSHTEHEVAGFRHTLYRQEYLVSLDQPGFCGGNEEYSNWMSRAELLTCLSHCGFKDVRIAHDQPDHPNGPAFGLLAIK